MKAYQYVCESCSFEGDAIVRGKEAIFCLKCGLPVEKMGGPIGGLDIMPAPNKDVKLIDPFVPYKSLSLKRMINTIEEMEKAKVEINEKAAPSKSVEKVEEEKPVVEPKKGRGRPKSKVVDDDDDDDKDDE